MSIPDGIGKPYLDNTGAMWVKTGSDKRRVTAREEMQRMFQASNLVHGDDVCVSGTSIADIDLDYFKKFYKTSFDHDLDEKSLPLVRILSNMRLASEGVLTVSGVLLFAKEPKNFLPIFHIKAVCYPGKDIHATTYLDGADIHGRLPTQFEEAMGFMLRNLRREQNGQSINSIGEIEIPRIVLEELLANALLHRDYFVSAPIRIFIFDDRIEILSPGHLPNNLTIENIQSGNSNIRNPILTSHATKLIPYRGLGSGIVRALKEYPRIDLIDDRKNNRFCAIIHRVRKDGLKL